MRYWYEWQHMNQTMVNPMIKEEKMREALQYIIDHKWVVTDCTKETHWKWINEFVDVAKKALNEFRR